MSEAPVHILITGSSGCLGAYLCDTYWARGCRVTGIDIAEPSTELKNRQEGKPGEFDYVQCDLANGPEVETVLADLHRKKGACDVVINCAGLILSAPLLAMRDGKLEVHRFEDWKRVIDVTLSAAFYVTAICAREMAASMRKGVIINISSICADGNEGQAAYSAAKAGINAMTVALAKELGPLGIRVAAVAPGFLDTASTRQSVSKERLEQVRKRIPLKRLGTQEQVLAAIDFVIQNEYFHGKVLELDGGLTL